MDNKALVNSKSRLAIELSKLDVFENPDIKTEQYPTDSEIAAEILWGAYMNNDIEGKTLADLGCGTGILGIGALLLGARLVFFLDSDEKVIDIAKRNLERFPEEEIGQAIFLNADVNDFDEKVDTVVQNPPFGTRTKHADKEFLMKAFEITDTIYSMHKTTSTDFLKKITEDNGFKITHHNDYAFPIKASHLFHKKKIHRIKVGCWRMVRE